MTDHKRTEEALRNAQADFARAARLAAMRELTSSIAHEVNQPLAAMIADVSACRNWLSCDPPELERGMESALRVIENADRATGIINSIRAMARREEREVGPLDFNENIQEMMLLLSTEVRPRSVVLETDFVENLTSVVGNRVQLQQVVVNLVMNGLGAMDSVADRPRVIRISTRSGDDTTAFLDVNDAGIGLDEASLARVFEPFYTTKRHGLGIGLSTCRSIVEAHRGTLTVRSVPGEGSTFTVALPMTRLVSN